MPAAPCARGGHAAANQRTLERVPQCVGAHAARGVCGQSTDPAVQDVVRRPLAAPEVLAVRPLERWDEALARRRQVAREKVDVRRAEALRQAQVHARFRERGRQGGKEGGKVVQGFVEAAEVQRLVRRDPPLVVVRHLTVLWWPVVGEADAPERRLVLLVRLVHHADELFVGRLRGVEPDGVHRLELGCVEDVVRVRRSVDDLSPRRAAKHQAGQF